MVLSLSPPWPKLRFMERGYSTGHGDFVEDLLEELEWQVAEREREACAKLCEEYNTRQLYNDEDMEVANECAQAIRARGDK